MFVHFVSLWLLLSLTTNVAEGTETISVASDNVIRKMYGFGVAPPYRTLTVAFVPRVAKWIDHAILNLKCLIWSLSSVSKRLKFTEKLQQAKAVAVLWEIHRCFCCSVHSHALKKDCMTGFADPFLLKALFVALCGIIRWRKHCILIHNLPANVKWLKVHFS